MLYRVCLAFTDRQPDSINDLYQEIVCNLWLGWDSFRGESDRTTWLYRVALNTAAMELRKHRRSNRYHTTAIDARLCDTLANDTADPRIERLYFLIEQLSADEKRLVFLYLDRLSHAQIAAIVGSTEEAVKHRIHRIKKKLATLNRQYDE